MKKKSILNKERWLLSASRIVLTQHSHFFSCSSKEGLQCVKRSDLIETLADSLPAESIRFGCQIVAIETNPITSFPIVHIADGSIINTKVTKDLKSSCCCTLKTPLP